jgi:hypothetical protein
LRTVAPSTKPETQLTSPWPDAGQSASWMHAPTMPPNACAHADGGTISPSQNPGCPALCRSPARQASPAGPSYFDCGDDALANSARHALPSPGRPAAVQHGL